MSYQQFQDRTVTFNDTEALADLHANHRDALAEAVANASLWAFRDSQYRGVTILAVNPNEGETILMATYQDKYGDRRAIVRTATLTNGKFVWNI